MSKITARTWVAATVVLALLLALASWFLIIDPVRAEAAGLRTEAADTAARNEQLSARTEELRRQFADLPDKQAELDALEEALPAEVELPTLIRTIDGFADATGVTVMAITPGVATPVVDVAAAAAAAPEPAPTEGAPAEGDAAVPAEPVVPAGPVTTATSLTTTVIGDFFDAQAFLRRLQADMPRAYLVRDLSVTAEDAQDAGGGRPATRSGDVTMTITADVFSRPSGLDADAATAPAPVPGTAAPAPGTVAPAQPPATDGGTAPTPAPSATPSEPEPGAGASVPPQDPADVT